MTVLGGRLLVADNTGDELWEIDPDGADSEGTLLRNFPTALTRPSRGWLSWAAACWLLIMTGDELWEIDPDGAGSQGTLLRNFPTALPDPFGMTVLGGRLLVADSDGDELWEIDPDGAGSQGTLLRNFPATLTSPFGMTVLGGRLLVADDNGDELWEIDPDGADTEGTLLRDFPGTLTSPRMGWLSFWDFGTRPPRRARRSQALTTASPPWVSPPTTTASPSPPTTGAYKAAATNIWGNRLDQTNLSQVFTNWHDAPLTEYEVQFRATNSEGDSCTPPAGHCTTNAAPTAAARGIHQHP